MTCDTPTFEHATITSSDGASLGDVVNVSCDFGYCDADADSTNVDLSCDRTEHDIHMASAEWYPRNVDCTRK